MGTTATTSAKFRRSKDRPLMQSQPDQVESEFPDDPVVSAKPATAVAVVEDEAKREALAAPKYAAGLSVTDQDTLDYAHAFLKAVKTRAEQIAASFDPQIGRAHELHKSLLAEKKKFTAPLEDAERIVKRTIAGYLAEEERKRNEIEAERARVEAIARAKAEAEYRKAQDASASGNNAKADAIIDKAYAELENATAAAPVVPDAPTAHGLALVENWKFQIIDKKLLPAEYLIPDEIKIGRVVRALKGEANIPGVRVYSEKTVSARIN